MSEIDLRLREEWGLTPEERREIGRLLASTWPEFSDSYTRLAWRSIPPEFRIVAFEGETIVGQQSVFSIRTDPQRSIMALGDVAVLPEYRRRGIGRALVERAIREAKTRAAETILTGTVVLVELFTELGFRAVGEETCYRVVDGRRDAIESWLLWEKSGEAVSEPFQVIDWDF